MSTQTLAGCPDVSRETLERLNAYARLIRKWSATINLVSRASLDDLWDRHIVDSAQLFALAPANPSGHWLDLGSGGGLPGMVIAILAHELAPDMRVTCIESDVRKATFLRTVARETGVTVGILSRRIEETPPQNASVLSARALAPLPSLLAHADRHLAPDGRALFPKGRSWRDEVDAALANWKFQVKTCPSATTQEGVVLSIGGIERV